MSVKSILAGVVDVLQSILGILSSFLAMALLTHKLPYKGEPHPGGHLPGSANNDVETILMYMGIAIVGLGFATVLLGRRTGWLQMVCGIGISAVAAFLIGQQNAVDYYLDSAVYYLAIIPLVSGIAVFTMVFIRLLNKLPRL